MADNKQLENILADDEIEIIFGPFVDPELKKMPPVISEQLDQLFKIINQEPQEVIPGLTDLVDKYPGVPVLSNLLYAAYSMADEKEKAEQIAYESFINYPDYIFAKINYAQICLLKGDLDKIPQIFQNKFDLKSLYPKRSKFHISEFVSLSGVISIYFYESGQVKTAREIYKSLKEVAPDHEMTKEIRKRIYPSLFRKLLYRIFKKKHSP
jgi:hypothetical protein